MQPNEKPDKINKITKFQLIWCEFLVYSFSKFILLAYFLYFLVLVYKFIGYDKSARNISCL